MTSQVYYRKWRPGSFSDLVGQEHVTTTLRQSIKLERVSHSYLFCGPRGTGKTTTARVLAKAVNCLDPRDGDPCNGCAPCVSANEGRFMDIIELDAASNRGIDEIRDIRDRVNFAPVEGRRKVYIIDEAHMLTDQASNAFLKTLEEPPGHVIFVLCTTEAHKILPTIISRCQRFDFRRLPADLINRRLVEIIESEAVAVEPDALRLVSRYAAGSLRDAENLLEQLVVSYGDGVALRQVEELLGLGHGDRWLELVKYLLMGNTSACLGVINEAAWDGTDLRQLQRQVLDLLRATMLMEWGAEQSVDLPDHVAAQLKELSGKLPPWRIVKAVRFWGEVNMRYDAPSTLPLELAVVEICNDEVAPPAAPAPAPLPERANSGTAPAERQRSTPDSAPVAAPRSVPPARPRTAPATRPEAPAAPPGPTPEGTAEGGELRDRWAAAVKALNRCKGKKYNLGALLRDCKPDAVSLEGDILTLPFTNRTNLERMEEELADPSGQRMVAEVVGQFFGASCEFRITQAEGNGNGGAVNARAIQNSPLVRTALGMGARIVEEYSDEP